MSFYVAQILVTLQMIFGCLCYTNKNIGQQNSQLQHGIYYWSKLLERKEKSFLGNSNLREFRRKKFATVFSD